MLVRCVPSTRNQITDAGEAARELTAEAIEALRAVCVHGRDEMARVAAAAALLDRGHGLPDGRSSYRQPQQAHSAKR